MLYISASNALVLLIDFLGPVSAAHVVPALLKAFPIGFGLLAHDVLNDEGSCGIGQRGGSALLSSGCTAVEVVGLIETCLACGQANVNTHALFQAALVLAPGGAAVFRVVAVGQPVIHIVVHDFLVLDLQRIAILCLISCPDFGAVGCPRYREVDVNRQIENGCAVLGFIQTIEDGLIGRAVFVNSHAQVDQLDKSFFCVFGGVLGNNVKELDGSLVHSGLCIAAQVGQVDFFPVGIGVGILVLVQRPCGDVVGTKGSANLVRGNALGELVRVPGCKVGCQSTAVIQIFQAVQSIDHLVLNDTVDELAIAHDPLVGVCTVSLEVSGQFLWGTRYIRDKFGKEQRVFWLPDTFGYSAALPQIMQGFGVTGFLTTKLAWNDTNRFPYETFVWKGIDGSSVVAHFFVIDTWPDPAGLLERIEGIGYKDHIARKQAFPERLVAFGYGDGGGGPQFEMIEAARRLQDLEGCPKVEYTSADAFVQKLEAAAPTLPVYDGELYLELHRGTLTAKQQIKKNNRMAENLLRMLELCLTRSAVATHTPADGTALRPLWNTLLVNQFHDILPGSCIAAANDRSLHDMAEMLHTGSELLRSWFAPAQNCYTVLNPLDEPCRDVFYLPQIASGFIAQEPGVTLQNVVLADGTAATAVYGLERPALGAAVLHFVPGEQPAQTSRFVYDGKTLTTPLLQVQLDELGRITSLVTRADGMQWADGPMNTLLMAEDVSAGWDGWDIDADCMMKLQPAARLTKQTVTADGPQEFRLHSRYELGTATILEQDMIFRAESTLVEWQTVLHWNEKHRVLKAAFPTNLRAKTARHEIQFGYIERPTTANDTREQAMFERCNHRYTDLSEPGRGLSIFNDCKYGISVQGGTMALTLAKGGTRPDERGDVGTYTFRYAIQPHAEGFSAKVPRRGMRFDRLPTVLAADAPSPALLTTSCRNVVVETVKPCEDAQNAMIVRLYECEGSHTAPVALHPGFAVTAAHQCDMAENAQFSVDLTNLAPFKPFEVRTVKIEY